MFSVCGGCIQQKAELLPTLAWRNWTCIKGAVRDHRDFTLTTPQRKCLQGETVRKQSKTKVQHFMFRIIYYMEDESSLYLFA